MIEKPAVMPKGIIHWVDAKHSINVEVRLFDHLFNVDNAKEFGADWMTHFNKDSMKICPNAVWFDMY